MALRKNTGRQIVDTIRKVTTKVGVVKDLYGDVFQPAAGAEAAAAAGWYFFKLSSDYLPSLSETYKLIVENNITPEILPVGDNNKADLSSTIIGEDANNLLVLMAGVEVPRAVQTSITIECENTDIILYVNNQKIIESTSSIKNRKIYLSDTERNLIQVVMRRRKQGGTKVIYFGGYLQLDPTIPVIFKPLTPGVPEWPDTGSISYGSLDGNDDHVGIILTWYDNPFAAGWDIERYAYTGLGPVSSVSSSGTWDAGTYRRVFVVSGNHSPQNVLAVWGDTMLGKITGYTAGAETTSISVEPEDDTAIPGQASKITDGALFYEYTSASIVASVDRQHLLDLGDTVKYVDTSVIEGMPYSYRLAARAIHDRKSLGPYSTLRTDNAYDDTPPGPIVLWPDSISAVSSKGPLITVQHIYPADDDLAGYRIYVISGGRSKESYTGGEKPRLLADLGVGSSAMRLNYTPSGVNPGSLPDRYGQFDVMARSIQHVSTELVVDGYICTTYDYAGNERSIPSGTDFTVTFLVLPPENFTAYGNLVSPSLGARRPSGVPKHLWGTALDVKTGQELNLEST